MKMLDQFRSDPRIESIEDERGYGNGWWVYLAKGWAYGGTGEAHCFSEDTLRDVKRSLRVVSPCACGDCLRAIKYKESLWS